MNNEVRNNRMSDVTLTISKADNTPLANQEVIIEQTRHKFLFGTAAFDLVPLTNGEYEGEKKEQAERRAENLQPFSMQRRFRSIGQDSNLNAASL